MSTIPREIVIIARQDILNLDAVEQSFHGDLLSPYRLCQRHEQECRGNGYRVDDPGSTADCDLIIGHVTFPQLFQDTDF